MLSGIRSGLILRKGYSVAGAERSVLVSGFGARIVGDSLSSGTGSICLCPSLRGPVRTAEGRICSKPWDSATFSIDLKYCGVLVAVLLQRWDTQTYLDGFHL
jgi:hypothetical protein